MSTGQVYLVGAGPGDPGLLTIRGRDLLSRADVVVYDNLISPRLLDYAPAEAERIYAGKRAAAHAIPQDQINELLVEKAGQGLTVVRLKGGDPYVFGRGGEEALSLEQAGIAFEEVPGVTTGVAVPAYAGIPVTHRDLASAVGFVTGHEADGKADSAIDWAALARWPGTLVFFMGVGNLPRICANLIEHGLDPETPAAAIHRGTTPRQKTVQGLLRTLPEVAKSEGLKPPALILVGQVAGLRDQLNWFERRPLFGRRILVTRSRQQASQLSARLEALGAEVIEAPTIRIEPPLDVRPLARAAKDAARFDWIVFTSVNAVDAFFGALAESDLDARALSANRICAVGPATARRLGDRGIRPDAIPATYKAAAVADSLAALGNLKGRRILCPRSDIAPKELPESLAARGAEVSDIVAYRTVADCPDAERIAGLLSGGEIGWLTFTSSSTVRNLVAALDLETIISSGVNIGSIGPSTSATLREFKLEPTVEADPHTTAGLVEAVLDHEKQLQSREKA